MAKTLISCNTDIQESCKMHTVVTQADLVGICLLNTFISHANCYQMVTKLKHKKGNQVDKEIYLPNKFVSTDYLNIIFSCPDSFHWNSYFLYQQKNKRFTCFVIKVELLCLTYFMFQKLLNITSVLQPL